MKKISLLFALVMIIQTSCLQGKKEILLEGKWKYEEFGSFSNKEMDTQDPFMKELHEKNKGLMLEFTTDKTFRSVKKRGNEGDEVLSVSKYELSADKKFILIKDGTGNGFHVVELSDEYLKINFGETNEEYLVFKRVK